MLDRCLIHAKSIMQSSENSLINSNISTNNNNKEKSKNEDIELFKISIFLCMKLDLI